MFFPRYATIALGFFAGIAVFAAPTPLGQESDLAYRSSKRSELQEHQFLKRERYGIEAFDARGLVRPRAQPKKPAPAKAKASGTRVQPKKPAPAKAKASRTRVQPKKPAPAKAKASGTRLPLVQKPVRPSLKSSQQPAQQPARRPAPVSGQQPPPFIPAGVVINPPPFSENAPTPEVNRLPAYPDKASGGANPMPKIDERSNDYI